MQQLELAGRDYNRSEDVIKLLQSTQQSTPYQYAVLHCTGFIRFGCVRCTDVTSRQLWILVSARDT